MSDSIKTAIKLKILVSGKEREKSKKKKIVKIEMKRRSENFMNNIKINSRTSVALGIQSYSE